MSRILRPSLTACLMACCVVATVTALPVLATERMYGLVGVGYGQSDFDQSSTEGITYKLGVGYQFHRQWYAEAAYQRIANESVDLTAQASITSLEQLEGDALSLSVLGKAGSREGELFYRLGILRADMTGYRQQSGTYTAYNDSVFAGTVGLGFDWYIGLNTMLRFEVEHIAGEDDLQVSTATLGFRYNFN